MITPKRFFGSSGPLSAGRTAFYRLLQVTATEEPASVGTPADAGSDSLRVAEAQMRAERRLRSQRDTLRPLGLAVIVVVAVGTFNSNPRPAWHGSGLGVTLALAVFAISVLTAIRTSFIERGVELQTAVIAAMGAAGVAIAALQPRGAAGPAVGGAVWMAVTRLPLTLAITLGAATTFVLDVASALAGSSSSAVLASTLLCALIGLIAYFLKQARESQDRTEVLLAQLEDAREQQTRAAAIAERGRIASELHDASRIRSPAPRSSCKAPACSRNASRRPRRCAARSTGPASSSGMGLWTPGRPSARYAVSGCPASTSSTP